MAITAVKLLPNGIISKASILDPIVDDLTSLDGRVSNTEASVWQTIPLLNGWTGTGTIPSVRKAGSTTVQIAGQFVPSATKANGTSIGTIPAGFRPLHDVDLPISCDVTIAGGQAPHIGISAATGNVVIYGVSSANTASVYAVYPTNL